MTLRRRPGTKTMIALSLALLSTATMRFAPPARAAGEGTIKGIVTAGGEGRTGVTIEVYLERKKTVGGTPFAVTESAGEGRFEIVLPAGSYYLWARGAAPSFGPPLVSEYAANPVAVAAGGTTVLPAFALREAGKESLPPAPKGTGIVGRVTAAGQAAADVSVVVYDAGVTRLTGPGFVATLLTGPDGRFQIDLPPGSYRVAARKRASGAEAGFLRSGDLTAEFSGNPARVTDGSYADLGELQIHAVDARRLAEREQQRRGGASPTRLSGTVTGPDGNPLAGQYVLVYKDQSMIGRPDLMTVSGADGSFAFDLPGGGTWYLGARSTMGGPRQPGEMAGRIAGSPDSSTSVVDGAVRSGLIIRMESVW